MGFKQIFLRLLGIKPPQPTERPANSVKFWADARDAIEKHRKKDDGPFGNVLQATRDKPLFEDDAAPADNQPIGWLPTGDTKQIGWIETLPVGTSPKQYLALFKNMADGDYVIIEGFRWFFKAGHWLPVKCPAQATLNARKHKERAPQTHSVSPVSQQSSSDPLLNALLVYQLTDMDDSSSRESISSRSSHSVRDTHRHEDTSHHHSTTDHSSNHYHSGSSHDHDTGSNNYDSGSSGGSSFD